MSNVADSLVADIYDMLCDISEVVCVKGRKTCSAQVFFLMNFFTQLFNFLLILRTTCAITAIERLRLSGETTLTLYAPNYFQSFVHLATSTAIA